ncbi:MAG: hypothetical protein JSV45_09610 [Chromatiales bacterium]|nr:MAG: hypothetical protein JSV45_09610 [Chromatiales bacterium]
MPDGLPVFLVISIIAALLAAALVAIPLLRQGGAPVTAFVLALGIPAGAVFLYLAGSNYGWTPATTQTAAQGGIPDLNAALAQLEARLQAQPDDRDGWLLLGNTYLQMQRPADAETAFGQALALSGGEDPTAKLGVAEALVLQDRNALTGQAGTMIEEVLATEPDNAKALWYGGLAALARGDRPTVQARWERMLNQDIPDPVRQAVTQQMQSLGFAADTATAAAPAQTAIDVRVSVSDALEAQLAPDAMLFLVARDANAAGGPPVAAVREQAAGLPRMLRISDANAMLAGRNLSQLQNVRLIARVSNGGGAIAQPGDVFGEATWAPGEGAVTIVMDQVVEP